MDETEFMHACLADHSSRKLKRLINPNNKTIELTEEDKNDPVKVIQALVKRFSGRVSVQAERTVACFKPRKNRIAWFSEMPSGGVR